MPDGTEQTTTETTQGAGAPDDAAYYKAEAQKAFKARDEQKARLRELESKVLSEEDRALFDSLREQQAKAEEDKAKKAGEFETLKTQLSEKQKQIQAEHLKTLDERDKKYTQLTDKFKNTIVKAEFGAATDYFGGDSAKTILDVELGMAALGKYVQVEDVEDDVIGYRVIVKKPNGDTIFGADGNPAPFPEAIGELIKSLPNRDRILRGSGKTGSGSSGGSTHAATVADVTELTRLARAGDKAAIEKLKVRRQASGGMVMGEAFTR